MRGAEVTRVGELVLAWLLTRADGKGARSDVSKALKPFSAHRWSPGEWSQHLDTALESLRTEELITQTARKGLELTAAGRTRGLAFLGVKSLPKGMNWKTLRPTHLIARSLGLPAEQGGKLRAVKSLQAVLVQRQFGMEGVGERTLKQVQDELCWKQLGVKTDKPLTLAAVKSLLLGQVAQSSREVTASKAMEQLAARQVGARRTNTEGLRQAVVQSWLLPVSEPVSAPAVPPAPAAPPPPPRAAEDSLSDFAERVVRTAQRATSGRFGDDKVFISHVWRALGNLALDERAFKNRLLEANQKRLLSLSRADMVELMDPADVSSSEIRYLGDTFHFITLQ